MFLYFCEIYSSVPIEVLCLVIYSVWNITLTINRTIDYFSFRTINMYIHPCIFMWNKNIFFLFILLFIFTFIFVFIPCFSFFSWNPMILKIELWNIYVCIYNIKIINYNLIGKTGKCKRNSLSVLCRMQNLFLFIYLNFAGSQRIIKM